MTAEVFTGIGVKIQGHLKILEYPNQRDYTTGKYSRVLLNKRNAVHKDNAAILLANALTKRVDSNALHTGSIAFMVFGNGGTTLQNSGTVVFKTPNDQGPNCNLYNQVFFHMVDDFRGALPGNQMAVRHISNSLFTDCEIRCLIGINEPFSQIGSNMDSGINLNTNPFAFDEIGLKTTEGDLVTHVIFSPVLKTASSLIEVIYTLRVMVAPQGMENPLFLDIFPLTGVSTTASTGSLAPSITQSLSLSITGLSAAAHSGIIGDTIGQEFNAGAVFLDGSNYLWNFPAMTDSPVGSLSYWMYVDNFYNFTPPNGPGDGDLHSNLFFQVIQGAGGPDNVAVFGLGQSQTRGSFGLPSLEITAITRGVTTVVAFANPHGIQSGCWVKTFFFNQVGWQSPFFDDLWLHVLSVTSTTVTLDIDTSGLPAYVSGGANFIALLAPANATGLGLADDTESNDASFQFTYSLPPRTWINVLWSWDTNHPAENKIAIKYFNETQIPIIKRDQDISPAFSIGYSTPDFIQGTSFDSAWKICGPSGYTPFQGGCACYLAEFWFAPGQFIDFTDSANRAKFHDLATGKPVNLGADGSLPTGTAPVLYQHIPRIAPDPYSYLGLPLRFINMMAHEIDENTGTLADGVTTTPLFTMSLWAWGGLDAEFEGNNKYVDVYYDQPNVRVTLWNADRSGKFAFNFPYPQNGLKNICFAVDTNHNIGSKIVLAYVNNSPVAVTVTDDTANNLQVNWVDGSGYFFYDTGFIANAWIGPGQFFDPVDKFMDLSGNPINLGANGELVTGTAPSFYFHISGAQPASDFATNLGVGGPTVQNGDFSLVPEGAAFCKNNTGGEDLNMSAGVLTFPLAPTSPSD